MAEFEEEKRVSTDGCHFQIGNKTKTFQLKPIKDIMFIDVNISCVKIFRQSITAPLVCSTATLQNTVKHSFFLHVDAQRVARCKRTGFLRVTKNKFMGLLIVFCKGKISREVNHDLMTNDNVRAKHRENRYIFHICDTQTHFRSRGLLGQRVAVKEVGRPYLDICRV